MTQTAASVKKCLPGSAARAGNGLSHNVRQSFALPWTPTRAVSPERRVKLCLTFPWHSALAFHIRTTAPRAN